MTYPKDWGAQNRRLEVDIERCAVDIKYCSKALNLCADDDPYKPNIASAHTESYAQLGHCYFKQGNYVEAIHFYQQARNTDPDHFQALYQLGKSYQHLKQPKDARNTFNEIIDRIQHTHDFHHKINAWFGIAGTYIQENRLEKANQYISLIQKTEPHHPDLIAIEIDVDIQLKINKVRTHLDNKEWIKANTALGELKQLAPNHSEVSQLKQYLEDIVSTDALTKCVGTLFNPKPRSSTRTFDVECTPTPTT